MIFANNSLIVVKYLKFKPCLLENYLADFGKKIRFELRKICKIDCRSIKLTFIAILEFSKI